jgi:coiled-coil domain-containing protein 12
MNPLEEEARKRKERLAALKAKKGNDGKKRKADSALAVPTVEETVEQLKHEAEPKEIEVDLQNLAPKKVDWDLEREVESKLQKLERRTTIVIAQIIRMSIASLLTF